jgi:glucose-6-phosphate 1-dehydrogenase
MQQKPSDALVLFGATGDLAFKKSFRIVMRLENGIAAALPLTPSSALQLK